MKLATIAFGAVFAAAAAGSASAEQISIGTSPLGSAGYAMGSAIAKLITQKLGIQARVQPFTGNSIALVQVNSGEIDMSVCNEIEAQEALQGTGPYHGRQQKNLRVASIMYPFPVAMYVPKSSPIKTMAELRGKRVSWGFTAQLTLKQVVGALLANGGLTPKDISQDLVPNVNRGGDDVAAGKADAFFHSVGSGKVSEVDAAVGGLRALPVDTSPAAVAAMHKILPEGYVLNVKPRPGAAGIDQPTDLLAYDYLLVVGKHMKPELVQKLLKVMAENKQTLVEGYSAMRGFDPEHMSKKMDVEYHPGAIAYLKSAGQWPPK